MINLANAITLGRLVAVPVIIWMLVAGHRDAAFWLFVVAGISDAVDGFLAKRCGMETALGRYLDPIADKALLVSIYCTLGLQGYLPNWLVILVISRDVLIVGAVLLSSAVDQPVEIRPTLVSKANTVAQIMLAVWILAHFAFDFSPLADNVTGVLVWSVAVTTAVSWYRYLVIWLDDMSRMER